MDDFNPTPPEGTRPLDPPELVGAKLAIIAAGIQAIWPGLKNDYEKTIYVITAEKLKRIAA